MSSIAEYYSGAKLYGDDFEDEEIERWFAEEEHGFYGIAESTPGGYVYEYSAFNEFHAHSLLKKRSYRTCLALGCARGEDVSPLASVVDQFLAIEPATEWWRSSIGNKPATYVKPTSRGNLPVGDNTVDLAVALGVLHHIPNVSFLLSEFHRVLSPGGILLLREPISSMGDWRRPRPGLTKNERGLPVRWLRQQLQSLGFEIERERFCMFQPTTIIAQHLGVQRPFNNRALVLVDWLASTLFSWNRHYRRDTFFKKLAPSSVLLIARKA